MAAINMEKSKALAALTSAALGLPGLNATAAIPASQASTNVSYGHYQESGGRMQVDVYHADALLPLSDRLEIAFSLDRDTYSGATPAFSLPATLTNLPRSDYGNTVNVDLVSAASGAVTAGGMTILGGLNTFQSFQNATSQDYQSIQANIASASADKLTARNAGELDLTLQLNAQQQAIETNYQSELATLNAQLPALASTYAADQQALIQSQASELALYQNTHAEPDSLVAPASVDFGFKANPSTPDTVLTEGSYLGHANATPNADGSCVNAACVQQNGLVVGTISDPTNANEHLHRGGTPANRMLAYHEDSAGFYIRALDASAFSFDSIKFSSPYNDETNPTAFGGPPADHDPALDYYEILGFSTAVNPNLSSGDGTNYAERVAYQTIANGFDGTLTLNSDFRNVKAVWIHYKGGENLNAVTNNNLLFKVQIDNIAVSPTTAWTSWKTDLQQYTTTLNANYAAQLATLTTNYNAAVTALTAGQETEIANAKATRDNALLQLNQNHQSSLATLNQQYADDLLQLQQLQAELTKQSLISAYRGLLDSLVPTGTPTVQRFQMQPLETRSMPQFNAKYYFDNTTLGISGGLSDEPDFLSNFGSVNLSHEFNDKLTTISGGYGITSNTITRNGGGHASHHANDPAHNPTAYPALNEESTFHSVNTGLSQVLSKNSLLQLSANYTHQSGYLSNPYKYVYVRGEITPEEYYQLSLANTPGELDWNSITKLEVVGTELFRETRPRQRNIWSFSNRLNQHLPALDASLHLDYRFYIDDWGINSHTFEAKWYQSLPGDFTVTPSIRYYSQSQAEFFAPYFLAPRADGHYSSDFRLSAFGDLSGGVTVSKQFARGIKLEAGFEYVTHSGALKLGGGGVGDYADFSYYLAHANLNIDLSARAFTGTGAGDHDHHAMHRHGAPLPAGVMYGHMMNQADDIMIGYRYNYSRQGGSMLHGSDPAGNLSLVENACGGFSNGCLYRPTQMHMQMHMLDLMYAPTDWLNIMVMPQLMSMDMSMSDPIRAFVDSTEAADFGGHGGAKHTSNDIGDTVATALVKIADMGPHHLHLGLGISAPTGSIDAQLSSGNLLNQGATTAIEPGSPVLQDYGMQLGSGTWDFKPSLTYTGQQDDWSWGAQFSGVKRLEKNKYGFAYGDIFQGTAWGSYSLLDWLSGSIRGVFTWQDAIRGQSTQNRQHTATVDYSQNYGGRFFDVGFGLNATVPGGQFAGHQISFEWLQPVLTDYNGYQLDRNGALSVNWSYAF